LEEAGVKLARVLTDVLGVSGRAMRDALLAGTTDPTMLAELARGRLRSKIPALRQALHGQFRPVHAFLIGQILTTIDFLEETITSLSEEIDAHLRPFEATVQQLMTIPGVKRRTATTLLVETGGDMTRVPTAAHLCSWGAMCPGLNESAGKRRTGKTREGNRYVRGALIESALAATRTKRTALQAAICVSGVIADTRKPSSPWDIRSSKSRTPSCETARRITNSGLTISPAAIGNGPFDDR
jgi:transposase